MYGINENNCNVINTAYSASHGTVLAELGGLDSYNILKGCV